VEDESHELLEDFRDEIPDVQEQDEGDEEEYEPEADETRTHAQSSSELPSGTGHRKIATIIAIIAILLGLLISTHQNAQSKPKVIYAKRYSKEHRFRPAASPIITETLKDGRIRIRGAEPTMSSTATPKPTPKRKRKARSKSRNKKAKA